MYVRIVYTTQPHVGSLRQTFTGYIIVRQQAVCAGVSHVCIAKCLNCVTCVHIQITVAAAGDVSIVMLQW